MGGAPSVRDRTAALFRVGASRLGLRQGQRPRLAPAATRGSGAGLSEALGSDSRRPTCGLPSFIDKSAVREGGQEREENRNLVL